MEMRRFRSTIPLCLRIRFLLSDCRESPIVLLLFTYLAGKYWGWHSPTESLRTLWHACHTPLSQLWSQQRPEVPWAPGGFCASLGEVDLQKHRSWSSDDKTCGKVSFKLYDYFLFWTFTYIFSSSVSDPYRNDGFISCKNIYLYIKVKVSAA